MSKLDIVKKILAVIQGSQPISDRTINPDCDQVDSREVKLMDGTVEEQEIKRLSRDFAIALKDRDFEHLDGRSEYHLYTIDHLIELIKNNDEQNTVNFIKENKIKSKYESCEFVSIAVSTDREQAEVVYNVITCVVSADDKYYKELNKKNNKKNRISEGTPYRTTYTLLVKKEKGTWKIDQFEASKENVKIES